MTVESIIKQVQKKVDNDKLAGTTAVYQFVLTGKGGGSFYLPLEDGKGHPREGTAENPDITVTISMEDFHNLVEGKLSPMAAFMSGRIKIEGEMALSLKLQRLIG